MSEQLTAGSLVWVAGWNTPGYIPESEPAVFARQEDARGHIADEFATLADALHEEFAGDGSDGILAAYADGLAGLVRTDPDQDHRGPFTVYVDTGRSLDTAYWVDSVPLGDVVGRVGWRFAWSDDWAVGSHVREYGGGYEVTGEPDTCETCTLYDAEGNVLASLGCIDDADDDYRRTIEFDLLTEAVQ